MLRRLFVVATLGVSLFASARALALPAHGGSGGTPFDLDCGGDAVLAGIRVRAGTLIDKVEPICMSVTLAGGWKTKFGVGAAGGTGGTETVLTCDTDWAVMGIKGASGTKVDSLAVHCGHMGRASEVIQIVDGKVLRGPVGGTGGTAFDDMCPSGQIGRGLKGRASSLVDQIELACHNPHPLIPTTERLVGQPVAGFNPFRLHKPAMVASGSGYLLVHEEVQVSSTYVFAQRLSSGGAATGLPLALGLGSDPDVAFDGTRYLVVWADGSGASSDIRGVRISATGTRLDASPIRISFTGKGARPAVAFNGTHFVVAWEDGTPGWDNPDIRAARVNGSGAVIDTSGIQVVSKSGRQREPAVTCSAGSCLVAWRDSSDLDRAYGALIAGNGTVGAGVSAFCPAGAWQVKLAFDGTNYMAACPEGAGRRRVGAVRISTAGAVVDPTPIAISPSTRLADEVTIAFDGTNYLIGWGDWDTASSDADVVAARVTPGGTLLDSTPIALSAAGNVQYQVAAAGRGGQFVVAWADSRNDTSANRNSSSWSITDLYGTRVSGAGAVLDGAGLDLRPKANQQLAPAVAFDGTHFLVVWQDDRAGDGGDIYGLRLSAAGTATPASPIAISTAAKEQSQPAVTFDGANFLVVWKDKRGGITSDIYAARVSTAGAVLDPSGLFVSGGGRYSETPAVTYGGGNYFVVWADGRTPAPAGNIYYEIYGAQIRKSDMVVLQETGIRIQGTTTVGDVLHTYRAPDVQYDGTNFMVVWEGGAGDVFGKRVSTAGALVDSAAITISGATGMQSRPRLAQLGTEHLVVWQDSRNTDIRGQRITKAGALSGSEIAIGNGANAQSHPVVTQDGDKWVVFWADARAGTARSDIYATRVSRAGQVESILGAPVAGMTELETAPAAPAAAYQAGKTLVVYQRDLASLPPGVRTRMRVLELR